MRVLVACEFSGTVRDAFAAKGHDAWSCDLLPTEKQGQHYQGDLINFMNNNYWDLMIAHPPCTYLTTTGARWYYHPEDTVLPRNERRPHPLHPNRRELEKQAIDFFLSIASSHIPKIAIENPIGSMSRYYRKPDQIINPWQFGHSVMKATCLWLKGLPKLQPTNIVDKGVMRVTPSGKRVNEWHWQTFREPIATRWKVRSKTFQGIADAMAEQWGDACKE